MDKQEIFNTMILYINKDVFLNTGKKILSEEQLKKLSDLIDRCSENVLSHYTSILSKAAKSETVKKEDVMQENVPQSESYVSVMNMINAVPELKALLIKLSRKKMAEAAKHRFLKPAIVTILIAVFAFIVMASGSVALSLVILALDLAAFICRVI